MTGSVDGQMCEGIQFSGRSIDVVMLTFQVWLLNFNKEAVEARKYVPSMMCPLWMEVKRELKARFMWLDLTINNTLSSSTDTS